jgi:hypothetical protein
LRIGPSLFVADGPQGFSAPSDLPSLNVALGHYAGAGVRLDYTMQKGRGHVRWHVIASLYVDEATDNYEWDQPCTPYCGGIEEEHYESAYFTQKTAFVGGFLGTGFRLDTDPAGDTAFVLELDGTIGGSSAPHFGAIGLHFGFGLRFARYYELFVSGEADSSLLLNQAQAAILVGRAF